ncbi:hypothetical protein J6590_003111 [Homalodisca vitripennis]|nr:hypothetical protein J6590_003111 [Homalodisca vitripennis]
MRPLERENPHYPLERERSYKLSLVEIDGCPHLGHQGLSLVDYSLPDVLDYATELGTVWEYGENQQWAIENGIPSFRKIRDAFFITFVPFLRTRRPQILDGPGGYGQSPVRVSLPGTYLVDHQLTVCSGFLLACRTYQSTSHRL